MKLKDYIIFIGVSIFLFALMVVLETKNGKFSTEDFKVFYMAAQAMINGEQIYNIPFGLDTGLYKYSPVLLFFFSAYTLFSFKIAAIIHFTFSALSAIFSIIILEEFVNKYLFTNNKRRVITSFLILFSVLLHIVRDLHMGNTNIIIVFLLVMSIKLILESKQILAGVLIGLVILAKPYFIILVLALLLYKKYKAFWSVAVTGLGLTLLTGVVLGFTNSFNIHLQWFNSMLQHSVILYSPHTIFYLLEYYVGIVIPQSFTFPFFLLVTLSILGYFWYISKNYIDEQKNKAFILSFFILIAIIPSILITDVEHFIFSLPIITILILYLKNKANYLWIALFVLAVFMFAGNSQDLVGKDLTMKIKFWGWVGIANLSFITLLMVFYSIKPNSWKLNK